MIVLGGIYRHFKGNPCMVKEIVNCAEINEKLVIYTDLINEKTYAKPLSMFREKVDRGKYPEVKQEYRFQHKK